MNKITNKIRRFLSDESGPTAVEYAVLIALIITVIVAAVTRVGGANNAFYGRINDDLNALPSP